MQSVRTLIIGAGVSGLATAAFLKSRDLLVLEADAEIVRHEMLCAAKSSQSEKTLPGPLRKAATFL